MLDSAKAKGLLPSHQAEKAITRVVAQNDYVRVRYMVVETENDLAADEVLRLAEGDHFPVCHGARWYDVRVAGRRGGFHTAATLEFGLSGSCAIFSLGTVGSTAVPLWRRGFTFRANKPNVGFLSIAGA